MILISGRFILLVDMGMIAKLVTALRWLHLFQGSDTFPTAETSSSGLAMIQKH
jgi:hypothetical protein